MTAPTTPAPSPTTPQGLVDAVNAGLPPDRAHETEPVAYLDDPGSRALIPHVRLNGGWIALVGETDDGFTPDPDEPWRGALHVGVYDEHGEPHPRRHYSDLPPEDALDLLLRLTDAWTPPRIPADCVAEWGPHDDHGHCEGILRTMSPAPTIAFDPTGCSYPEYAEDLIL